MTRPTRTLTIVAIGATGILALVGCVAKADTTASTSSSALAVSATADACELSDSSAESGTVTFTVANKGEAVTEFYMLADDGLRIVGEVENIAPGASRTLTVTAQPGEYFTVCKPGMIGEGVGRASFTVSGDTVAVSGEAAAQKQQAVDLYGSFVKDQVEQLVPAVATFVAAYTAGDDDAARQQFPLVRAHYERIEPVAESLGDLDPRIDYREVDAVAEQLAWTGFHRIEKELWIPAQDALNADQVTPAWQDWMPSTSKQRAEFGTQLVADVAELDTYVHSEAFTKAIHDQGIAGVSNGAIALLDEVATGKISGEEDWWSGTDLYDFAANVEGSQMAFSLVREFAQSQGSEGADLVEKITSGYERLNTALSAHGSLTDGFPNYSAVNAEQRRELSDQLNALAEPLSKLTGTILD